jgi:ubiquinone/menaquinone biosynthesis C-methylase UbiE
MKRLEQKNSNTREYYNQVFTEHFAESGLDLTDVWRVQWLLGRWKGGRLLDIGCGISPLPIFASQTEGSEVFALDFADEIISQFKGKSKVQYMVGDMYDIPFEDKTFDYVVLGEVLEHSEFPEKLITEASRVTKDDGIIAISCPNNETDLNHIYPQHIWGIKPSDIRKLVKVLKLETIGGNILCYAKPNRISGVKTLQKDSSKLA